jgi:PAS domain S-box-containing protein
MKLERRLLWLSLGVLLLGVVLNSALLLIYEQATYRDRIVQDLQSQARILGLNSAAALAFNDPRAARENLGTLNASPSISLACLYDLNQRAFARYSPTEQACPAPDEGAPSGKIQHIEAVRDKGEQRGTILLQQNLPSLAQRLPRYSLSLLGSIGVEALLILVLVLALRARVLRPVDDLARLAKRVTDERDYRLRVAVRGDDEISALGDAVNRMLEAVEERDAAVRDGSRLLQNLIDHAPATITVKSRDGHYLLVNKQFASLTGRAASTLIGQDDAALFGAELAATQGARTREVAETGKSLRHEETLGGRAWLSEQFPLKNSRGITYALASIATDITEQRATRASLAKALAELTELNESLEARVTERSAELERAMQQLVQSEKLAALGSLVAGVAHELNTPIGMVVTLSSSLIEKAREFLPQLQQNRLSRRAFEEFVANLNEGMELIEKNSLRAGRLISDFKQVAVDQTSMRRRHFALDELVANTLHSLAPLFKHRKHRVESRIAEDLDCDSYPGAIEQIMTNLIQNALIHGLADKPEGRIEISAHREGDSAVLQIQDDGKGIEEPALRHIFEPFFTTRLGVGGSGLGLYIVHTLACGVLGGEISASNAEGGGARFRLIFPLESPVRRTDKA